MDAPVEARAPMLAAEGVHTYYGASHVLQGVDFRIRPGETVGLMGRNGMGKTTLLRTMLGFVRPREGTVKLHGEDMTHAAPHAIARRGIATIIVDKNFAAVSKHSDRSVILVKGRVVFDDTSESLRRQEELHLKYLGV